jgi:glucosylceramidase
MRPILLVLLLLASGPLPAAFARTPASSEHRPTGRVVPGLGPTIEVFQTDPVLHQYLAHLPDVMFSPSSGARTGPGPVIYVDDEERYQPIWGVGATITNSSSFLLVHGLYQADRAQLLSALFAGDGAHLSWIGVTIGGSDFNAGGSRYSEDDMPQGHTDAQLKHFSLKHDQNTIAVLHEALKLNPDIRIIARPWSAPAWMKTNDSLTDRRFAGVLEPKWYGVYARYFVKYLQGFQRAGIPIYAVTVQNEPVSTAAGYEGMHLPAAAEGTFIEQYLLPALKRAGLRTKIYATDESWRQAKYTRTVIAAAGTVGGISWHCYDGDPDDVMPEFRSTPQVLSECANNLLSAPATALLANVFSDGARAAALWNMALNPEGGPAIHPDGCPGCHGIITIDPKTHRTTYNQAYYELAQFGHFLQAGACRIAATRLGHFLDQRNTDRATPGLQDVAFRNANGSIVLVLYNNGGTTAPVTITWRRFAANMTIPPRATTTLLWN